MKYVDASGIGRFYLERLFRNGGYLICSFDLRFRKKMKEIMRFTADQYKAGSGDPDLKFVWSRKRNQLTCTTTNFALVLRVVKHMKTEIEEPEIEELC